MLLGRALRDRCDGALVASKFGNVRASDGRFLGVSGKPDYVRTGRWVIGLVESAGVWRITSMTLQTFYQTGNRDLLQTTAAE